MLEDIVIQRNGCVMRIEERVRVSDALTEVFHRRMQQLEGVHRWLAGYLQAVGIMIQIPGVADCEFQELPNDDDLCRLIWNPDRKSALNVLAAALERLDCGDLLRQLPGGEGFTHRPLPVEARVYVAERDRLGLLNIVADCLDRLLVVPHIPDAAEACGLTAEDRPKRKRRPKRCRAD